MSPSHAGLPHRTGLVSAFCSSAPRFAAGFLSTPASLRRSCLWLSVPLPTARRGLAPPSSVPCVAHMDLDFIEDGAINFALANNLFEHLSQADIARVLAKLQDRLAANGSLNILQPNYRYAYR